MSATATISGRLGADSAGCLTVDDTILVLGPNARVTDEGSLLLGSHEFDQGDDVTFVGGFASAPPSAHCQAGLDYWWV